MNTPMSRAVGTMPTIRSSRNEPPLTFFALIVTPCDSRIGSSAGSPSGGMTVVNEVYVGAAAPGADEAAAGTEGAGDAAALDPAASLDPGAALASGAGIAC